MILHRHPVRGAYCVCYNNCMSSTPDITKNNWHRFGDPDSNGDEIEFDPDADEVLEDDYGDDSFED